MVSDNDRKYRRENDLLRARFTMWLNTTLIHARQRFLEKNTQRLILIPLDEALAESLADPNDCFMRVESSQEAFDFEEEKLAQAFSALPLMRREVLRLLFVEELTPGEIAAKLHCSMNYVHKQKSRALQKLRAALTDGDDDTLDQE